MRIGELEGEGAIEEFSSWWREGGSSFHNVRMPFSALLSGWARTDSRTAREWMLEHLPGDRADPDCTLDEAIQKIGEDALLKHLGLQRAEPESPASPGYLAPVHRTP